MKLGIATAGALALLGVVLVSAAGADVVTDWNGVWLQAIRATGGPPSPIARAGALLHVAIYDAVNSIDRSHEPYFMLEDAAAGTSKEAAAAMAAHRVLRELYPDPELHELFDAQLAAHLDAISDGPAEEAGKTLGGTCADGIMGLRADDGSDADAPYVVGRRAGDWISRAPLPPTGPSSHPGPCCVPTSSAPAARRATRTWRRSCGARSTPRPTTR